MHPNNNFIITETDQSKQRCTAVLLNYLQHARKLPIGQCIASPMFEMKCAKMGHCRWMLIVFPAGQYEYGTDSGQLSVYLKMVECEHETERLLVDVKFFIGSEEKFSKTVRGNTFQYSSERTRWVGTNLTNRLAFYAQSNSENLLRDNDLVIGCRMIHSTTNDVVEFKQKRILTLEHKNGNPAGIDVQPSSRTSSSPPSVIPSQIPGGSSAVPSTIISESSSRRMKDKRMRRIFCC